MIKLIALYRRPTDPTVFDTHFDAIHVPLLKELPGLRTIETTRVNGAPIGEAKFYAMAELYFEGKDAMDAALGSKQGKAVIRDLMSFAADLVTVFYGEPSA